MSEVRAPYVVQVQPEPAKPVICPSCGILIGHAVMRGGERWLAAGALLLPYLPGSTLCAGCESPVYYGQPFRKRARKPDEIWDGRKFVKVEEGNGNVER